MSFIIPFLNFLQPGILWPEIAFLRPMLVASGIGLLVGFMRRSDYPRKSAFTDRVFVWMTLFLLAQALSVIYGGVGAILEEAGFWDVYLLFVVISVLLMNNPVALKRYVWGMIVGGMVVVAYGIYAVPAFGGYEGTGRAGAYGMYENHNDYSFIIIQIVPFIFMYMRTETTFFRRALLACALVACIVGILMSLSRGGMIALMIEMGLIVVIGMQSRRRWLLLPVLVLVAAVAIGYQYAKRAENQGEGYTAQDAEEGRLELWKAGYVMLKRNPFFGVGSRRFPEYAWQYYDLSRDMRGKVSHNTYVEVLATSGILGFVPFIAMLVALIRSLRRIPTVAGPPWLDATRKATLICIYAMLFRAFLDAKPHDWSFYVLCALAIAVTGLQRTIDTTAAQTSAATPDGTSMPRSDPDLETGRTRSAADRPT